VFLTTVKRKYVTTLTSKKVWYLYLQKPFGYVKKKFRNSDIERKVKLFVEKGLCLLSILSN